MAVGTTINSSPVYAGDGITSAFNMPFTVLSPTEISVWLTTGAFTALLTLNAGYTVLGNTVTLTQPLPVGSSMYATSNVLPVQRTVFGSQGGFYPAIHEDAFDRLTVLIQQTLRSLSKTLQLSASDSTVLSSLPSAALRANRVLGFDSLGNTTTLTVPLPPNIRGAWVTATLYNVNDQFTQGGLAYVVTVQHTSGVFATDATAGLFIIQQGLNSTTGLRVISSLSALRLAPPVSSQRVSLSHHTTPALGGGGIFRADTSGTYVAADDDNGTVIVVGTNAWIREHNDVIDASFFGVAVDGVTDDTAAVQRFIGSMKSGQTMTMKAGVCMCDDLAPFNAGAGIFGVTLDFSGVTFRRISTTYNLTTPDRNYNFEFSGFGEFTVKGIVFDRKNSLIPTGAISGILLTDCINATVEYCDFTETLWGVVTVGALAVNNTVQHCRSNYQVAHTPALETNRQFNEFIFRTFGNINGTNHSHKAINCTSKGSAIIFQPHLSHYSEALFNYSENSWSSPIYLASNHCIAVGNVVKNAGKDGIKLNAMFDGKAVYGGILQGNHVDGCGLIRVDGGQLYNCASIGAVVSNNTAVMSSIALGAAPEQNAFLIIGNDSNISNNNVTGYAATPAGIAAGAAKEGSAFMLRGLHLVNAAATPPINFNLGCSGNRGAGNTAKGVNVAVNYVINNAATVCSDNFIECDCTDVTHAANVYSQFAAVTDCGFLGDIKSCAVALQVVNSLRFRMSSKSASLIANKFYSLNSGVDTIFKDIFTDGSAPNANISDATSSIKVYENVREGLNINVSQDLRSLATATVLAEGNTIVRTNGVNSAFTLQNGAFAGQRKMISSQFISALNTIAFTGIFAAAATTLTFSTINQFSVLTWNGVAWSSGSESTVVPV